MKKFLPTVVSSLISLGNITNGLEPTLHEALPIFWQDEPNHFVSEGEETAKYGIHYVSPCGKIYDYAKHIQRIVPDPSRPVFNNQQPNQIQKMQPAIQQSTIQHVGQGQTAIYYNPATNLQVPNWQPNEEDEPEQDPPKVFCRDCLNPI